MFCEQTSKGLNAIWLGLTDLITENTFQWNSDLSTPSFTNWNAGNSFIILNLGRKS